MKKLSFLAISIALVLSGCDSDSGSSTDPSPELPPTNPTVTNAFIDAAVEGIYYSAMPSGLFGFTDSDGSYEAKEQDTITFFLGGENGVKIGAASNREVLTPFEAAGKYNRALNLAIILQSLDTLATAGDSILTIPDSLKDMSDPVIVAALAELDLDDRDSSIAFLTAVGVSSAITEDVAIAHMDDAFGKMARGSDTPIDFFKKGSGSIIRAIEVLQYKTNDLTYVHADKLLAADLFEATRGMVHQEYRLDSDNIIELAGSNDSSLTEGFAKTFLDCLAGGGEWDYDNMTPACDGGTPITDDRHELGNVFAYSLLNQSKATLTDTDISWDDKWIPLDGATEQELNHYSDTLFNDNDGQGTHAWQRNITSGSYDPMTQIYTEIRKKTEISGSNCDQDGNSCTAGNTVEIASFYYEIPSVDADRYVDFKGTWKSSEICEDGDIAEAQYIYSGTDMTMSGFECEGGLNTPSTPSELDSETHTYESLATIDYWWFNQANRESKATLTELNSVVRFCDDDNYVPGNSCSNEFFIKWNYQPAGENWDEGLLIRHKFSKNGSLEGTITMQKVK